MHKRIYNIEFLRVVFCIAIVCVHLFRRLKIFIPDNELFSNLARMVNNAPKAVDGFFILSGIFLYLTYKDNLSIMDFIKKKIVRLWPVVIFVIILGGGIW